MLSLLTAVYHHGNKYCSCSSDFWLQLAALSIFLILHCGFELFQVKGSVFFLYLFAVGVAVESAMEAVSRIPRLRRSVSFQESAKHNVKMKEVDIDEDVEAEDDLASLSSVCSVVSCSGPDNSYRRAVESASHCRSQKPPVRFAMHCTTPTGNETYLTPTQRANRSIRQLKSLLKESYTDARYKDFEIQRLTRELVELRLEHAHCKKAEATEAGADTADTPDTADASHGTTPSLADSGLFDDAHLNHSKESLVERDIDTTAWSMEKRRLLNSHAEQIGDMKRQFADEVSQTKLMDSNHRTRMFFFIPTTSNQCMSMLYRE